jgi:hypothetical protein
LAANLKDKGEGKADKKNIHVNHQGMRAGGAESNKFYFMEFIIIFEPFGLS